MADHLQGIRHLWLYRRGPRAVGCPDIGLDELNLWDWAQHEEGLTVHWWREATDIPLGLDPREHLVYAPMPPIYGAMARFGLPRPSPEDVEFSYPLPLRRFLGRTVRRGTFTELSVAVRRGERLFAKPTWTKKFTGRMVEDDDDLMMLLHCEGDELWLSEALHFRAEWRFFIANGQVVGSRRYKGDPLTVFDPELVREAVDAYERFGAPGGYALDFGMSDRGFVLVEANQAHSLGGYEVEPDAFFATVAASWLWWVKQTSAAENGSER